MRSLLSEQVFHLVLTDLFHERGQAPIVLRQASIDGKEEEEDPSQKRRVQTRGREGMKKESIHLSPSQRKSLEDLLRSGKALAWTLKHAQVLLKVDRGPQGPGWTTSQIIEA